MPCTIEDRSLPGRRRGEHLRRRPGGSALIARLLGADPAGRTALLSDPAVAAQARRQIAVALRSAATQLGLRDRWTTQRWIEEHATNLRLPGGFSTALPGDERARDRFVALLELAADIFAALLPRQHGRHFGERATALFAQRLRDERPDVADDARVFDETVRLYAIEASPYRWHRSHQHQWLWKHLLTPNAATDPETVAAAYDAYIDAWAGRCVAAVSLEDKISCARSLLR